jgi:hypothetical protein
MRHPVFGQVSDPVPVIAEKQSLQSRREVKEEVQWVSKPCSGTYLWVLDKG